MDESNPALAIHHRLGRHPAQFKQFDLLPVKFENLVRRIGHPNERQAMFSPVSFEGGCFLWPDHHDITAAFLEIHVCIAQLRHVSLAKGS